MNRLFADRLNKSLDDIDAPEHVDERVEVFAKLLKIPRFKASSLLNGTMMPDETLLALLANEFEVSPAWLIGDED